MVIPRRGGVPAGSPEGLQVPLRVVPERPARPGGIQGHRITFREEQESIAEPIVDAEIRASEIEGYLAGVRVDRIGSWAHVTVRARVGGVRPGGTVIGVDADSIE